MTATTQSILVICPFPEGIAPAQRLKYEQYIELWRAAGATVDVSPFMDMDLFAVVWKKGHYGAKIWGTLKGYARRLRDVFRVRRYDTVYLFLWVTPIGTTLWERLFRALARRLVYDIDDNVHLGQSLETTHNPNPFLRFLKNPGKPLFLMREADYVVASSPFLEADARAINRKGRALYITSSVDTDHFRPRLQRPDNAKIVVGWTGTFSSRPFLDMIAPMLAELSRRRDFEFRIVGNFDYAMDGVDLKVVQFSKVTEIEDLDAFDIGIYPLPDDPWVYGKSGLKAIVYMAMGLPVVASHVGTTPLLFEHGDIGSMVATDAEWLDALTALIDDAEARHRKGANARKVAVAHYSRDAVAATYQSILDAR